MHRQLDEKAAVVERSDVANMLTSTDPATGEEIWSGELGDADCRGRRGARRLAGVGGAFGRLPDRGAAPLRQCRPQGAKRNSPS